MDEMDDVDEVDGVDLLAVQFVHSVHVVHCVQKATTQLSIQAGQHQHSPRPDTKSPVPQAGPYESADGR